MSSFLSADAHGQIGVRIGRSSGTAVFLKRKNLRFLPDVGGLAVDLQLPNGEVVAGKFTRTPENPFIGGPEVVAWIKSVLTTSGSLDATLVESPSGRLRLDLSEPSRRVLPEEVQKDADAIRRILEQSHRKQRRHRRQIKAALKRWERSSTLRAAMLATWPHQCQVDGCEAIAGLPDHLRARGLELHHVSHVAAGGSDDPENLILVCATHHRLVHAPDAIVTDEGSLYVEVTFDHGFVVTARRPENWL